MSPIITTHVITS